MASGPALRRVAGMAALLLALFLFPIDLWPSAQAQDIAEESAAVLEEGALGNETARQMAEAERARALAEAERRRLLLAE